LLDLLVESPDEYDVLEFGVDIVNDREGKNLFKRNGNHEVSEGLPSNQPKKLEYVEGEEGEREERDEGAEDLREFLRCCCLANFEQMVGVRAKNEVTR